MQDVPGTVILISGSLPTLYPSLYSTVRSRSLPASHRSASRSLSGLNAVHSPWLQVQTNFQSQDPSSEFVRSNVQSILSDPANQYCPALCPVLCPIPYPLQNVQLLFGSSIRSNMSKPLSNPLSGPQHGRRHSIHPLANGSSDPSSFLVSSPTSIHISLWHGSRSKFLSRSVYCPFPGLCPVKVQSTGQLVLSGPLSSPLSGAKFFLL